MWIRSCEQKRSFNLSKYISCIERYAKVVSSRDTIVHTEIHPGRSYRSSNEKRHRSAIRVHASSEREGISNRRPARRIYR